MKPSELAGRTDAELTKLSQELEQELFQLRFRKGAGLLKKTADIKNKRRDLARVKTILHTRLSKT